MTFDELRNVITAERMIPLAIDLYCGLGGWAEGLLAEGYYVVGFDVERHDYGTGGYPAQLVLQDVTTLSGAQLKNAALIVASPPCQEFSYMAMPWSKAKAKQAKIEADPEERKRLTSLFDACFRIQREAIEAAGHFIPLVVENVRGAQKWVGRSRWNYGSFHLWGDVPALMPITPPRQVMKQGIAHRPDGVTNFHGHKNNGGSWFNIGSPGQKVLRQNPVHDFVKIGGDWFSDSQSTCRRHSSGSNARKAASAAIAKIPLPLARHIARCWLPKIAVGMMLMASIGCGDGDACPLGAEEIRYAVRCARLCPVVHSTADELVEHWCRCDNGMLFDLDAGGSVA